MARMMTAALLQVGLGKISGNEIRQRLANNSRANKASREVAPAGGLFLSRVRY
jgi:tRNA U38,U39,U40 pseudouridine synthase TruA